MRATHSDGWIPSHLKDSFSYACALVYERGLGSSIHMTLHRTIQPLYLVDIALWVKTDSKLSPAEGACIRPITTRGQSPLGIWTNWKFWMSYIEFVKSGHAATVFITEIITVQKSWEKKRFDFYSLINNQLTLLSCRNIKIHGVTEAKQLIQIANLFSFANMYSC